MLEAVHTLDNVATGGGCDDADGDMNACATFDVAAVAAARTHVRCEQCWIWSLRSSCGMLLVLLRLLSLFYSAACTRAAALASSLMANVLCALSYCVCRVALGCIERVVVLQRVCEGK